MISDYKIGHRQRLRDKFLETRLVDAELIELLMTYAIPRIDVKPAIREMLHKFGGFHNAIAAPVEELMKVPGIGKNSAIFLKALHELTLREYILQMKDAPVFHKFEILENYCKQLFAGKTIEEFHILYLDKNNQLIEEKIHSVGTIDQAAIYPREIVKHALNINARSIVLTHNHPNETPTFSFEDISLTTVLRDMLKAVGIELFDHLLVANGLVFSAKAQNLLK
ncbi:MAG: DNA repair protein RadC [Alphaproteobacteria bacterium]|nr:DNA repair protein RadC [Alphaproteobacteria bacterium]